MGALGRAPWVDALLRWFRRSSRKLPWRGEGLGWYHVLVAELMLIRTRADVARRLYERLIALYPTPQALCEKASPEELERMFSAIGLPRRGRWLWEAVCRLLREHGGRLPCSLEELMRLPGVGRYIARVLAARFCGMRYAFVDANVLRVLERLYCRRMRVEEAEKLLEGSVASQLYAVNVALLDLAALVCKPRRPACSRCPIREWCCYGARGSSGRV